MDSLDLKNKSTAELKTLANRLRTRYDIFKTDKPFQQNEEMINEFLLIKAELKNRKENLLSRNTSLDIDARAFVRIAQIKLIPTTPTDHTFDDLAPVKPSGDDKGNPVVFDNIEPYFKSFIVTSPAIWIVGGVVEHPEEGTVGDIDILVNVPSQDELEKIIAFRIHRMFPPEMRDRLHIIFEKKGGLSPFTNNLELFRLKLERVPDAEIQEMMEDNWDPFAEIRLRTKGTEKAAKEANKAAKEDKITFGEFFLPQKPTRGYIPGQAQTLDYFISLWKDNQFPVYSSRKADGLHTEWHISKTGTAKVYTEDGVDETSSFPETIKKAKELTSGNDMIFLAEVEWWDGKQHYPREVAAGNVHKTEPNESGIIVNVYDCVYYDGDIHKKSYGERWALLKNINFPQKSEQPSPEYNWNLIPHIKNNDKEELKKETDRLSRLNGSEGNVAKQASAPYSLGGRRPASWIKYHNSTTFTAIVLNAIETKTKNVFNLEWGILPGKRSVKEELVRKIDGTEYIYGGKTFSTKKGKRKDRILIECETFNVIYDMQDSEYDISAWAPRMMGITDKAVQTIDQVERNAIEDRVFQAKLIDEDGKMHYLPGKSGEEISSKSEEWSDKKFWTGVYEGEDPEWTKKKSSNLTRYAISKYHPLGRVLEIGSAAGIDSFMLATAADSVVGIDIVDKVIKQAKENLKDQAKPIRDKITFEVGDAEKLKFDDNSFDFVFSLSVLHDTDIAKSLAEINRVLSSGGKAVIYAYVKGERKVSEKEFIDESNKYFIILDKSLKDATDSTGTKRAALIVELESKK